MRKNRKAVAAVVAAATVAAATIVVPQVDAADPPIPEWRVLKKPNGANDDLPPQLVAKGRKFASLIASPSEARFVGKLDGKGVFLVPGNDGSMCFTAVDEKTSYSACADRAALQYSAHALYWPSGNGKWNVVVPVPDAYSVVKAGDKIIGQATANVVLAQVTPQRSKLRLEGTGVEPVESSLHIPAQ